MVNDEAERSFLGQAAAEVLGAGGMTWVGYTDQPEGELGEGDWRWVDNGVDGVPSSLEGWAPGEPGPGDWGGCGMLHGEGGWGLADAPCDTALPFLCEREPWDRIKRIGANEYLFTEGVHYSSRAQGACSVWGGHLVAIHSAGEQELLRRELRDGVFWTGYADWGFEDRWYWAGVPGDETPTFTAWAEGQPAANGGLDRCTTLGWEGHERAGTWSVDSCGALRRYVCERRLPDLDQDRAYYAVFHADAARTWADARAHCAHQGGYLAELSDDVEGRAVAARLIDGQDYWIGLNDREQEGAWRWENGSSVAALRWAPGGEGGDDEDCVSLMHDAEPGWAWAARDCQQQQGFVCEFHPLEYDFGDDGFTGSYHALNHISSAVQSGGRLVVEVTGDDPFGTFDLTGVPHIEGADRPYVRVRQRSTCGGEFAGLYFRAGTSTADTAWDWNDYSSGWYTDMNDGWVEYTFNLSGHDRWMTQRIYELRLDLVEVPASLPCTIEVDWVRLLPAQ